MTTTPPICYIVAGPNGAGKTTFALTYLPDITSCRNFINVDDIARGLSPLDISMAKRKAGELFFELLAEKLQKRENFAFETTLSGLGYSTKIPHWQNEGWQVILLYLYLPSPEFSAHRVASRVREGGHDIPLPDITRRYPRSIKNIFKYMDLCDATLVLDNSQKDASLICEKKRGGEIRIVNSNTYQNLLEAAQK